MNIAILDDSKEDLRQVKSVISSYYESQNTSADIHLYSSAEAFFTKYIPGFYDLIIMDIYMGSMTGMDAARKLREARDTAALIFISSSDSFAVESYDVQASYYLLKPFDPEKLCRILSTIQFRQSQNSRYIELISDRTPVKIPVRSILYVDTYRNAVQVHTMTGNQLGRAIGLNKAFGTRITQYETNARIPRPEILKKLQMFLTLVCFQSHRSSETCRRNLWKSCSGWMKNSGLPFPTTNTLPSRILIGIRTFSPA